MNKTYLLYIRALLALAALLGFIYLYGRAIIEALAAPGAGSYSDAYTSVATALAGLVGGVAATGLGQNAYGLRNYRVRSLWAGLGEWLAPFQSENLQETLAMAYTVVYIIFGVAAIIVWVAAKPEAPVLEMIRDLALIFLGLVVATAQAFLGGPRMPAARATNKPHRH